MNFIDIGLRLDDVEDLDLVSEPVEIDGDLDTRAEMLSRHGATEDEINFLLGWNDATQKYDHSLTKRVELNAMASRQFIEFIEQKLIKHGVDKLVPKRDIIEQHARRRSSRN